MTGNLRPGLRPFAVVALLTLVALAMATVAQDEVPPIPEDLEIRPLLETLCWECHKPWTPPMKDPFVAILPPPTTGAAIGTEFNWTVDFRMTWNPKPSVPHLVFVNPALDISAAPSLRFGGGPPDINGNTTQGAITPDVTKPTEPQQNLTSVQVPAGVTYLRFTLQPRASGAMAPDLTLLIRGPGANATLEVDANHAPGSNETHTFTLKELQVLGSGNWTVGARMPAILDPQDPPDPQNPRPPQADRVDYTVTWDAKFDTASLQVLAFPDSEAYVPGGGLTLQRWKLKFVSEPAPGESVRVTFDTVAWYQHKPPVTGGDFGGIRHTLDVPLDTAAGQPVLFFESQGISVRPTPINGPTLSTVSEAVGYASAFLLVSSIVSGGMFGQATRRGLNSVFHSAKRRVAFHNFLSYGLTIAALVHTAIFLFPIIPGESGLQRPTEEFQWTKGLIWGGIGIVAMFALGVTGAYQVPMIRRWSYPAWKWWHYGLTVVAILFTAAHLVLDGRNFGLEFPELQEMFPDPFYAPEAGM